VLHSFDSTENYIIQQLTNSNLSEFKLYNSKIIPQEITKNNYLQNCTHLINLLKNNELTKVVLSRVQKQTLNQSPLEIFKRLNKVYFNTFNYLVSIENVGTWLGATPEVLAEFNKNEISTVALAGTKTSNTQKWTKKEIEEQQIVTDYISKQLKPFVTNLIQTPTQTIKAGRVYHLKTSFTAVIKSPWTNIVQALHPTPATCGVPTQKVQKLISKIESHQREFYTGFLGMISSKYKILMVNLRCMKINQNSAFLYLGGGITADSNPNKEWEETKNKALTLQNVIK